MKPPLVVVAAVLVARGYFWLKAPKESAPISAQNAGAGTPTVLLLVGEAEAAIAELQRLFQSESKVIFLNALRFDPLLKPILDDPRVQALITEGLGGLGKMRLVAAVFAAPSSSAVQPPPGLASAKSVAVLAFKNLSGDLAREFFSMG